MNRNNYAIYIVVRVLFYTKIFYKKNCFLKAPFVTKDWGKKSVLDTGNGIVHKWTLALSVQVSLINGAVQTSHQLNLQFINALLHYNNSSSLKTLAGKRFIFKLIEGLIVQNLMMICTILWFVCHRVHIIRITCIYSGISSFHPNKCVL